MKDEQVDYKRLDYKFQNHAERYKQRIESDPTAVLCQECRGKGQYVDEYINDWPVYVGCGWCEGTGRILKFTRGRWLTHKRLTK